MINNIVFDFDGTLVDTSPVILATMRATIAALGLPERSEAECRATIGLRLDETSAVLFPGVDNLAEAYASTYRRLFNVYNAANPARPYPGVIATLRHLADMGVNMALASSRSRASLTDFCQRFAIADLFCIAIGAEDVAHAKPHPEPTLKILSAMGWAAEETIVVGDTTFDIDMGRAAGVATVGVTYGNHSVEVLEKSHPTWLIDRFTDLLGVVGRAATDDVESVRRRVMADNSLSHFRRRVYLALLDVPRGSTITYGELARRIGCRSPQAVGQALRHNPYAPDVPCHRVVAADGTPGGFYGRRSGGMIERKLRLLADEGVSLAEVPKEPHRPRPRR